MSTAVAFKGLTSPLGHGLLWSAVAISLIIHAVPLATTFTSPDGGRPLQEKPLDITLVNAKSAYKPTDAQVLAQANLDGGGTTDDDRIAKTPLPPTHRKVEGNDLQEMKRRVEELESAQRTLLTQAKSTPVDSSKTTKDEPVPEQPVSGADLLEAARAMTRLEAEIARQQEEYNKRPRKKHIGARAEEYPLAAYLEAWRQKIERIGTLNYPAEARGKLYGAVVIYVELNVNDGSIYSAEISRSSGYKVLDNAAMRILRMAAPYGPIPREPMGPNTILGFARTWHFTQGDAFKTGSAP
ncbi:MAG: TonB family protein [Azonexus sp.]|nr:TonB family protein [Azonexus sp.]